MRARLRNLSILVLGQFSFGSTYLYLHFIYGAVPHFLLVFEALKCWCKKKTQLSLSHTILPRSSPRTLYLSSRMGWSLKRGFSTIWRLNQNTAMKGRRVSENSDKWWKHNVGLGVSSQRRALSMPTMNRLQFSTSHTLLSPLLQAGKLDV